MQPNQLDIYEKRRKLLAIGTIIGAFILFIVIIISFILDSKKTATIDILVAPSFAKVEINGKKYKTEVTSKIKPGEFIATISADGFETSEVPIITTKGEETQLYLVLNPTTDNLDFYENNSTEANLVQRINEKLTTINAELYLKEHPIVEILPIVSVEVNQETNVWNEYRIDYGEFDQCKTDFCLKITDTSGGNYQNALQNITDKGFNPDDYEIIYVYEPVVQIPESTIEEIHRQYGVN